MIWMTKVELAQYLKRSTRTVERWVVQQKLPPGWRPDFSKSQGFHKKSRTSHTLVHT